MNTDSRFKRREKDFRLLASLIADTYRKGKGFPKNEKEPLVSEDEITKNWESDGERGFIDTGIVPFSSLTSVSCPTHRLSGRVRVPLHNPCTHLCTATFALPLNTGVSKISPSLSDLGVLCT